MFTTRVRGVGIALAVLLWVGAPRAHAEDPKADKVKELLKERLAVVQEVVKLATSDYQAGRGSIDRVHEAQMALVKARLELCDTDKQRIAILEEAVALAKDSEKTAEALYQAGKVPAADALVAKAARLDAQIALERARTRTHAK